jgi:hypothetical protein
LGPSEDFETTSKRTPFIRVYLTVLKNLPIPGTMYMEMHSLCRLLSTVEAFSQQAGQSPSQRF